MKFVLKYTEKYSSSLNGKSYISGMTLLNQIQEKLVFESRMLPSVSLMSPWLITECVKYNVL